MERQGAIEKMERRLLKNHSPNQKGENPKLKNEKQVVLFQLQKINSFDFFKKINIYYILIYLHIIVCKQTDLTKERIIVFIIIVVIVVVVVGRSGSTSDNR